MKLLFDQNLAPRLAILLADIFPGSSHVWWVGLDRASDIDVWEFARQQGFVVVTKDADFGELSTLRGFPPKVIWLQTGNGTTAQVEALLRAHEEAIHKLSETESLGILSLR